MDSILADAGLPVGLEGYPPPGGAGQRRAPAQVLRVHREQGQRFIWSFCIHLRQAS